MRVGMLTGGGDCPGLNPVIRAVCRRLWEDGHETFGVLNGWRGMIDGDLKPLGWDEISGILHKGGTIIGTSRTNRLQERGRGRGRQEDVRADRRARRDRRRGHARRRRAALRRGGPAGRRRPEDDRQRPQRHRLHVRLRHGRRGRDRRGRPLPLDRRVAQPDHRRRDDGPPRRLDRALHRHRRRRRLHPHPGAAGRLRRRRRRGRAAHARAARTSR